MGDLWALSVKLMNSAGKTGRRSRALEIQDSIRDVLRLEWDPIGVGSGGSVDEYDAYIAPIYRVLVTSRSAEDLIERLQRTERDELGVPPTEVDVLRSVARKLLELKVTLDEQ
jgi:hypothetical protein